MAPHFAMRVDLVGRVGASWPGHGAHVAVRTVVTAGYGLLALLFLVCALLPLLHVAGDVPRGFEVRPVLAHSSGLPASDAGARIASTLLDLDEACEEAVQPRVGALPVSRLPRPASPRSTGILKAAAAIPLDRPPRLHPAG
ncbi:hypothetical protein [Methylobacterium goesingense]|uniref:Uncharacterized protein n=1 Tax=Methylobacterium goesingense TaxID=243690 RepID=A0ABV2LCN0_9HYPH|nr:hypothetical protein [Methylobacterium goesingense]